MSRALKWVVVKAASAAARNVPTLFFNLYYREVYRQINSITKDPEETVKIARTIGHHSAQESAERRSTVLRLFPKGVKKLLGYLPLIWEIYFGCPMGEHKTNWTSDEKNNPVLNYIIEENPLAFGIGEDPKNDQLPWSEFWGNDEGYMSLVTGLLTLVINFVLELKEQKERVLIKHSKSYLRQDGEFVLSCTVLSKKTYDETLANFSLAQVPTSKGQALSEDFVDKISQIISIDKLEELFATPNSGMKALLTNLTEKSLHMSVNEVLGHFTNYEREFFKILGWIYIHGINEVGRITEKVFENEQVAKVYGHLFLYLKKNADRFLPLSVMEGFKNYFAGVFDDFDSNKFVRNFREIEPAESVDLIMEGAQKALQDLGVPFEDLKPSFYEEFQEFQKPQSDPGLEHMYQEAQKSSKEKGELMEALFEQMLLISTTILNIPTQLMLLFAYNTLSAGNEIFVKSFNNIKDAGEKITEILDKMNVGQ